MMRIVRVIPFVLALLLIIPALALVSPGGVEAQEDRPQRPKEEIGTAVLGDGLIVPGERIGPLRLGMSIDQLLALLPKSYKREFFDKQKIILYEWRGPGIWISLDASSKAVRLISVFGSGTYKTDKGVQLLHPEAKMLQVYGKEAHRYSYPEDRITLIRYVALGLQFGLVNQPSNPVLHGRIFTIGIFTPGKEPPLTKTPTNVTR